MGMITTGILTPLAAIKAGCRKKGGAMRYFGEENLQSAPG